MLLALFLSLLFDIACAQVCRQPTLANDTLTTANANSTTSSSSLPNFEQLIQTAADAWIYGIPVYSIAQTRDFYLSSGLPLNHVISARVLADASQRTIVRPNADTVYSIAFFDLSQGPVTLHIPSTTSIYFVAAMYDAYSNNFANPGTLENSPAGNYILYGPNDAQCGETVGGNSTRTIISPTNDVWMIARFYVTNATVGSDAYAYVNQLQDQLYVVDTPTTILSMTPSFSNTTNQAFQGYYGMNEAVGQDPIDPAAYDANYSSVGLFSGRAFRPTLSMANLTAAQALANRTISGAVGQPGFLKSLNNGWVLPTDIGQYGTNYAKRAYIAIQGLGALTKEQAIYPTYIGGSLSSVNSTVYGIFFPDGEPPVVGLGFWSLTLYDVSGYFVANSLSRYSLGSRDMLQKSDNGSFTIIASSTRPAAGPQNWLPAPTEAIWIPTLRVYGAADSVMQGNWTYPVITKMG